MFSHRLLTFPTMESQTECLIKSIAVPLNPHPPPRPPPFFVLMMCETWLGFWEKLGAVGFSSPAPSYSAVSLRPRWVTSLMSVSTIQVLTNLASSYAPIKTGTFGVSHGQIASQNISRRQKSFSIGYTSSRSAARKWNCLQWNIWT